MADLEDPPPTTTISTIAVRAGSSATIVVALLKSVGYVELRIDEMKPRLLEIGRDLAETTALQQIHEDLMQRLRDKEEQVELLLARADNLVHEKKEPKDIIVYEAMAKSLGTAWKELNKQLQLRSYLLADVLKFYELAQQHDKTSAFVADLLKKTLGSNSAGALNQSVKQINIAVNDIVDITALAVDLGSSIITQIRVLGDLSDSPERAQEILDACVLIEKVMLRIAGEWERVEEVWAKEKQRLGGAVDGGIDDALKAELDEIETWLNDARRAVEGGRSNKDVVLQQALAYKQRLSVLVKSDRSGRAAQLQAQVENFIRDLSSSQHFEERIRQFLQSADSVSFFSPPLICAALFTLVAMAAKLWFN